MACFGSRCNWVYFLAIPGPDAAGHHPCFVAGYCGRISCCSSTFSFLLMKVLLTRCTLLAYQTILLRSLLIAILFLQLPSAASCQQTRPNQQAASHLQAPTPARSPAHSPSKKAKATSHSATTKYFYLVLKPSDTKLPYYYSRVFPIRYVVDVDLANQQATLQQEFKSFLDVKDNYNPTWYTGNISEAVTNADRKIEITELQLSRRVVESEWP
jgi:hypothetical protein